MKTTRTFAQNSALLACSLLAAGIGLTGCMTAQNTNTLDALQGVVSTAPYVEAYLEFPGPNEKWAGPANFILHVEARDKAAPVIKVTPEWFGTPAGDKAPTIAVSKENMREQIANLAAAAQNAPEIAFRGCTSPVRIRLIRGDGNVLEKTSCRSDKGWPGIASQVTHWFMHVLMHGTAPALNLDNPATKPSPLALPIPKISVVAPVASHSPAPAGSPAPAASAKPAGH